MNIVWFKRDLRIYDHRALVMAAQCGPTIPLYIVEPDWWSGPDMSARQWAFARECLEELDEALGAIGQALVVRFGDVIDVLDALRTQFGEFTLWSHEETGNGWTYERDKRVGHWSRSNAIEWREIPQHGVIRRLRNRNGWAKRWDRLMSEDIMYTPRALQPISELECGAIPDTPMLKPNSDPCPQRQTGGRKRGLKTLESFLYERGRPYRKAMSSPISGANHCSRLSAHLAWGSVSMREVAQAGWVRQREVKQDGIKGGWRGSLSSFQARLHWRDHFTQKLEDEPRLEFEPLHPAYHSLRPKEPDQARLKAWQDGETGLPFVDACMRSLKATGWLNFRMRAMVMSVASYQLWLDWRVTGEHLARMFTDYEPGIHWPQVQMQSGTTGINSVRIYNPVKQGFDQDPEGMFVRKWVPELDEISDPFIHEPWRAPNAKAVLGQAYPDPIVEHREAAKQARERIWAIRKSDTHRADAKDIVTKHGSRKSGVTNPRKPSRNVKKNDQLSFDFDAGGETA